jgi:hypothetical protein
MSALTDKLVAGQSPEVLFHGPKDLNVHVDVANDSTAQGELLPAPWSDNGQLSDLHLLRGCKFEETVWKISGKETESKTTKVLNDKEKLGTYIQNLKESDQELKRLHASHILHESKRVSIASILQRVGPDEIVIGEVACKALINAPATGYDIVSDLVVVMTRIKSEFAIEGCRRRVYFFQVRYDFESFHSTTLLTFLDDSKGG